MLAVALRMKILPVLVLASCAAATALGATNSHHSPGSSQKGIAYRWVDEHGEVHYGDHIPPQYANQERTVLNAQGVEVGHIDAEKSAEQQATEARTRAALMRQKQHDAFLVTTYTSVKDIEALRDVRLDQLKGQRAAAEQYVDTLRTRLAGLQSRAQGFQPYNDRPDARRMPDDLAENLVRTVNEMRVQTTALAQTQQEEAELRAQFQADIERYRELHTIHQ